MGCKNIEEYNAFMVRQRIDELLEILTPESLKPKKETKMGKTKEAINRIKSAFKKKGPEQPEFTPKDTLHFTQYRDLYSLLDTNYGLFGLSPVTVNNAASEFDAYEYKLVRKIKVTPNPPTVETIKEY